MSGNVGQGSGDYVWRSARLGELEHRRVARPDHGGQHNDRVAGHLATGMARIDVRGEYIVRGIDSSRRRFQSAVRITYMIGGMTAFLRPTRPAATESPES
jgi:hypothetical protein